MKAVAVPYVIALILGIIVVAVIGYWFFVVAGGGGGQLSQTQCEARFIAFCTQYSAANYQPSGQTFKDAGCTSYIGSDALIGSGGASNCQAVLQQLLPTGSACTSNSQCKSGTCSSGKCA